MIDRILKALMSFIIGAMALLYLAHNIANVGAAFDFFTYTTSHADQAAYPVTLLPVAPAWAIVIAMALVFALEGAAAAACIYGGFVLFFLRAADDEAFEAGKKWAKIGLGCAIANWWGLFQVIAIAGYQLWQMPLGTGPDHGSWQYGAMAAISLIYLSLPVARPAAD
ncbi:DUF2165 family protein [Croceicoccus mobilis]|uniref:DUF2165 domain-containing protein n=1 Tax=Croceicoccus mobilis TaxID=1703339 RepID=A0A916YPJ1_9SPHN|nr:DUF2165 family protein [Croceicoccus mobilis]GGD55243.1 hypothetical protein GCM10010990_00460 [Croceicoccus mobilis]